MQICPCNSGKNYAECCEPFINGVQTPKNPEALMRSRYTAYSMANVDYIADTMKGPASVDFNKEHASQWANHITWQGLIVIRSSQNNTHGMVEFIAHYSQNGNKDVIYEISEFEEIDGKWYYIDGNTPKIGRNDHCPCGSHKKYKKCCG